MASNKKVKKYGNIQVPAYSLSPFEKDGYLTKQGGSIKTWKRRYFILKGSQLFYYKTPKDQVFTGRIDLEPNSSAAEYPGKKKENLFRITTSKRIFFLYGEKPEDTKAWIEAINSNVKKMKDGSLPTTGPAQPTGGFGSASGGFRQDPKTETPTDPTHNQPNNNTPVQTVTTTPTTTPSPIPPPQTTYPPQTHNEVPKPEPDTNGEISPRARLSLAKGVVGFLKDESRHQVLEFWQIWADSIPPKGELANEGVIDFTVATSADMSKLTWKTSGPQGVFIQKMVDFFWNVGAPESEIDRLNQVGSQVNPARIGSWIDMSSNGGMDGGWYFPVETTFAAALEAAESGPAATALADWAKTNDIIGAFTIGRDMGAAPPRQTEIRFVLPAAPYSTQLELGLGAFSAFGLPNVSDDIRHILKGASITESLKMSVVTSSEGFVRCGLLIPSPTTEIQLALCQWAKGNNDDLAAFEGSLGTNGPKFVEVQFLKPPFGYGVYKEGYDIVFHYFVGEEL